MQPSHSALAPPAPRPRPRVAARPHAAPTPHMSRPVLPLPTIFFFLGGGGPGGPGWGITGEAGQAGMGGDGVAGRVGLGGVLQLAGWGWVWGEGGLAGPSLAWASLSESGCLTQPGYRPLA